MQIVEKLIDLSKLKLIPPQQSGSASRPIASDMMPHSVSTNSHFVDVPNISHSVIYWKACETCYFLGCASPAVLGKYLWYHLPDIRQMMLMSICGQFNAQVSRTANDSICTSGSFGCGLVVANNGTDNSNQWNREMAAIMKAADKSDLDGSEVNRVSKCVRLNEDNTAWAIMSAQEVSVVSSSAETIATHGDEYLEFIQKSVWKYLFGDTPDIVDFVDKSKKKKVNKRQHEGMLARKFARRQRKKHSFKRDFEEILEERKVHSEKIDKEKDARAKRAMLRSLRTQGLVATVVSDSGLSVEAASATTDVSSAGATAATEATSSVTTKVHEDNQMVLGGEVSESSSESSESDSETDSDSDLDESRERTQSMDVDTSFESIAAEVDMMTEEQLTDETPASPVVEPVKVVEAASMLPELDYRSPQPYTTQFGRISIPNLIIITHCTNHARLPPEHTLLSLRGQDTKYKFGARLRGCNNPDFIRSSLSDEDPAEASSVATVTRNAVESSFSWLSQAVLVDIESMLHRIPTLATVYICHILCSKLLDLAADVNSWYTESAASSDLLALYSSEMMSLLSSAVEHTKHSEVSEIMTLFVPLSQFVLTELGMTKQAAFPSRHGLEIIRIILEALASNTGAHRRAGRLFLALLDEIGRCDGDQEAVSSHLMKKLTSILAQGPDKCDFKSVLLNYFALGGINEQKYRILSKNLLLAIREENEPGVIYEYFAMQLGMEQYVTTQQREDYELSRLMFMITSSISKPAAIGQSMLRHYLRRPEIIHVVSSFIGEGRSLRKVSCPLIYKPASAYHNRRSASSDDAITAEGYVEFPASKGPSTAIFADCVVCVQLVRLLMVADIATAAASTTETAMAVEDNGFDTLSSWCDELIRVLPSTRFLPSSPDGPPAGSWQVDCLDQFFQQVKYCKAQDRLKKSIELWPVSWLLHFLKIVRDVGCSSTVFLTVLDQVDVLLNGNQISMSSLDGMACAGSMFPTHHDITNHPVMIRLAAAAEETSNKSKGSVSISTGNKRRIVVDEDGKDDDESEDIVNITRYLLDGNVSGSIRLAHDWLHDVVSGLSGENRNRVLISSCKQLLQRLVAAAVVGVASSDVVASLLASISHEFCHHDSMDQFILQLLFMMNAGITRSFSIADLMMLWSMWNRLLSQSFEHRNIDDGLSVLAESLRICESRNYDVVQVTTSGSAVDSASISDAAVIRSECVLAMLQSLSIVQLLLWPVRKISSLVALSSSALTDGRVQRDKVAAVFGSFAKMWSRFVHWLNNDEDRDSAATKRLNDILNNFGVFVYLVNAMENLMHLVKRNGDLAILWANTCCADPMVAASIFGNFGSVSVPIGGRTVAAGLIPSVLYAAYCSFPEVFSLKHGFMSCITLCILQDVDAAIVNSLTHGQESALPSALVHKALLCAQQLTSRLQGYNASSRKRSHESKTERERERVKYSERDVVVCDRELCLQSDRHTAVNYIDTEHSCVVAANGDDTVSNPDPERDCPQSPSSVVDLTESDPFVPCRLDSPMFACLKMLVLSSATGLSKSFEMSWLQALSGRLETASDGRVGSVSAALAATIAPHHEAVVKASKFLQFVALKHPTLFVRLVPALLRELKVNVRLAEASVNTQPITGQHNRIIFAAHKPASTATAGSGMTGGLARGISNTPGAVSDSVWSGVPSDVSTVKVSVVSHIVIAVLNEPLWLTVVLCLSYLPRNFWVYSATNCGLHDLLNMLWIVFYRRKVCYAAYMLLTFKCNGVFLYREWLRRFT
jgi:hypothetical protein